MSTDVSVEIDGKPQKLSLESRKGAKVAFLLNAKAYEAEILRTEGPKVQLRLNGRAFEVELAERPDGKGVWEVKIGNRTRRVKTGPMGSAARAFVPAPPKKEIAAKPSVSVEGAIEAPMPGKILKVFVEKGQKVKKGEVLLTLEAMKMENRIQAPGDGIVEAVNVKPGLSVSKGEAMIVLKAV